jgi:hypothetical protein
MYILHVQQKQAPFHSRNGRETLEAGNWGMEEDITYQLMAFMQDLLNFSYVLKFKK